MLRVEVAVGLVVERAEVEKNGNCSNRDVGAGTGGAGEGDCGVRARVDNLGVAA